MHANGGLAVAIAAFRNQMVFHNIDNLSSLALHISPLLITHNIRWNTLPAEAKLPADKRRFFDSLDTSFTWTEIVVIPLGLYGIHTMIMFLINFIWAKKRIAARNYETMFQYFERQKSWHKIFYRFGDKMAPVVFVSCQIFMFCVSHLLAISCFYSYSWNTALLILWLSWSVWNASCFYMDYFAKKYETSMLKLEALQGELEKK